MTNVIQSNTSLFIIMSGFTTALQLRDRPLYRYANGNESLLPRRRFSWINFITTRAVGVFPVLW